MLKYMTLMLKLPTGYLIHLQYPKQQMFPIGYKMFPALITYRFFTEYFIQESVYFRHEMDWANWRNLPYLFISNSLYCITSIYKMQLFMQEDTKRYQAYRKAFEDF